jgi:prephenate dehydratase
VKATPPESVCIARHAEGRIAIQGELGSNSHMAALAMLPTQPAEILACATSAEVFASLKSGAVDAAVLPIENSLHGSVTEHYDLLLSNPVRITGESLLRIRHNVIAAPGVRPGELRRVMSHPVALSQCRRWLAAHPELEAVNFYDTAGSVKHVMSAGLRDTAGIAPELAARQYGAEVLIAGIEDHTENYTRFHLLFRADRAQPAVEANKASLALSVAHQPGTLVRALDEFARAGVNLTKIESRPVHGTPWEYVFFVDLRFESSAQIDRAIESVKPHCSLFLELGRYPAA